MDLGISNNEKNIDSFNIYSMINTKNKTITGDQFYVGEGVLKCNNYFISLDAICRVEIVRRQDSVSFFILMILIGVIICLFSPFLKILEIIMEMSAFVVGIFVIAIGVLGIFLVRKSNEKIPYTVSIHLSDNSTYSYSSLDKGFILEIMDVIQSCINDRRGGYNILMDQRKIERNTITNNGGNFNYATGGSTLNDYGQKETVNNNNNTGLTTEEWMNLQKFFITRQQEFSVGDRNYKICNNLAAYSQRRDANKIKGYLQTIGKEGIRMLLSAGTNVVDAVAMETVKPILQKILSLKG